MNLLTQLLLPETAPKKRRKKEVNLLRKLLFPRRYFPIKDIDTPAPKAWQVRGDAYGTVKPKVLKYLSSVKNASPTDVAAATGLHLETVRRGLRELGQSGDIECCRPAEQGTNKRPALWRVKD